MGKEGYLRAKASGEYRARYQQRYSGRSHDEIEESGISNNLNQYTKKANETGKLYEEDLAEIKKMNNEQTELLKKALEAVIHLYEEDSKKRK